MFKQLRRRLEFAGMRTIHRLPANLIRAWQEKRISALLQHTIRNVPLYRTLYANAGLTLHELSHAGVFPRLPLTSKDTFLGRPAEEFIDNSATPYALWMKTSGTSGRPFSFMPSTALMYEDFVDFACLRFLLWRGVRFSALKNINVARIKIRSHQSDHRLFVSVSDFLEDPARSLASLMEFKPFVLESYPSILLELAREVERSGAQLRPAFVVAFGEKLTDAARSYIEKTLQTEVYDRYGVEEMGVIGCECARHEGFHMNSESVLVEVVDEHGTVLPAGARGNIVLTDLYNYNMPFIRYMVGDSGTLTNEPCPCGLATPRLSIEGRYSSFLNFGGRNIHHLEFDGALDGYMNEILQYQVVKSGANELVVRIVAGPSFKDGTNEKIQGAMRALVGADVRVEVTREAIPIQPSGKSQIVIDESVAV